MECFFQFICEVNLRYTNTYSFHKVLIYLLFCLLLCLSLILNFFKANTYWDPNFFTEIKHHLVEMLHQEAKAQIIKITCLQNILFRGAQTAVHTEAPRTRTKQTCFSQEASTLKPGVHPWKNSMCSYLPSQKACPKATLKAGDF